MINNLTTRLEEEASSEVEHKGWCDTELLTNTQTRKAKTAIVKKLHATVDELKASMENLAMEVVGTLRPVVLIPRGSIQCTLYTP